MNQTRTPFYLNDREKLIKMFEEQGFEKIGNLIYWINFSSVCWYQRIPMMGNDSDKYVTSVLQSPN